VRVTRSDELADIGARSVINRRRADSRQITHVGAGTERATAAGDDDSANACVPVGLIEARIERRRQAAAPPVHPLGSVQGDQRYAGVAHFVEHRFFRTAYRGGIRIRHAVSNAHSPTLLAAPRPR
jgi:hypothetical protein